MDDLFISYASEDREQARTLALALEARGWSVWWDREIPLGKSYDEVIEQALADARCMLVLWSKASAASEWVRNEASEGKRRGILVPVFIEDVDAPLAFRLLNGARLEHWDPTQPHAEFERLNQHIAALLAVPRETRIPPVQAKAAPDTTAPEPPQTGSPAQDRMQWKPPRVAGAVAAVSVLLLLIGGTLWMTSQPSPPSPPADLPASAVAAKPAAPVPQAPVVTPPPVLAATPARPTPLPSPPKPAPTVKPPPAVAAIPARPTLSPSLPAPAPLAPVATRPSVVAAASERPTSLPNSPTPAPAAPVVTPPPAVIAKPARPTVAYAALGLPSNRRFWSGETRAGYTQKMHAALQQAGRDVLRMNMHELELDQARFDPWWNESGQQRSRELCAAATAPVALLSARLETPTTFSSIESAYWPELKLRLYLCANQRLYRQQKTLSPMNPDAWPFATELNSEIERFLRSYRADLAE